MSENSVIISSTTHAFNSLKSQAQEQISLAIGTESDCGRGAPVLLHFAIVEVVKVGYDDGYG